MLMIPNDVNEMKIADDMIISKVHVYGNRLNV